MAQLILVILAAGIGFSPAGMAAQWCFAPEASCCGEPAPSCCARHAPQSDPCPAECCVDFAFPEVEFTAPAGKTVHDPVRYLLADLGSWTLPVMADSASRGAIMPPHPDPPPWSQHDLLALCQARLL